MSRAELRVPLSEAEEAERTGSEADCMVETVVHTVEMKEFLHMVDSEHCKADLD